MIDEVDVIGLLLFLLFVIANAALGTQRNSRRRSAGWDEIFRELTSLDRQGGSQRVRGARPQRSFAPTRGSGQARPAEPGDQAGQPGEGASDEWTWEPSPVAADQAGLEMAAGPAGLAQVAPDVVPQGDVAVSAAAAVAVRLLSAPTAAGGLPGAAIVLYEVLGPPRARRPWRPQAGARRA